MNKIDGRRRKRVDRSKRENRTERGNQKSPIYIEKILGSTSVPFQMI